MEETEQRYAYSADIPELDDVDVLIIGGGPSGISAAVAAARLNVRVRLIERYGFLGGNLTAGLVGPCMTSYSLDGSQQLIRGVYEEFVQRMMAIGGALHPSTIPAGSAYCGFIVYGHDKVTPFEPEAAKVVAQRMCLEAGVDLLLHTMVVDAIVDDCEAVNPRILGVVCAGKGGLRAARAKVVVDCSADGDVAHFAGVHTRQGRDSDGLAQPQTLFFRVQNVNDQVVEEYVRSHPEDYRPYASIVAKATAEGRFPAPRRGIGLYKTMEPGVWRINTGRVLRRNGADAKELTLAEIEGREQTVALLDFFRNNLPGFEKVELRDTATQIGVRETRRIDGDYELTLDDLRSGRSFEDVIALCGYPLDIHDPTGSGGGTGGDAPATANIYQIPYRVMLPRYHDGLLVSGRAVSATHEALSAIRVMPPCFALGQAAGIAAALSVGNRASPRHVDYEDLRRELLAQGAYLG
ncbi:FAD-dependent oxidoreductase [Neorhizobium sp. Rsf11]|uniref:FAD-dependent oxidoreductase n=2 Tax=Neorhizobium TaxID=1525371 RepID=A0ABV0LZY4_9HYPH|nr:FAD-dependent oxidoreductase [Neorhizobium petrolearium]MCC2612298.1 FAD-dependent oxidoreductase [Neorhizobium petrolearium]WGI67438.1 FAD-dependent oxidoreductase [Neorhizobium petrolearium]